jgi:hypothetical protein
MSRLNKKFFSRLGIRKVDVPNLSGLNRAQSIAVLNAVGLVPVDVATTTENINLNLGIVSQSQPAGSTVLIGSQVTFNYYNYVAPPNFNPGFASPGFVPINPGFLPPPGSPYCDGGTLVNAAANGYTLVAGNDERECIGTTLRERGVLTYGNSSNNYITCYNQWYEFPNDPYCGGNPGFANPGFNPGFEPVNPGFDTPFFVPEPTVVQTFDVSDLSALFSFSKSVGITTLVRTTDGLVKAGDLQVGDTLLSANIQGFPYESSEGVTAEAIAWSDNNPNIIPEVTTIVNLYKTQSAFAVVINEDIFSQYHYILIKRDGVSKFETSVNVVKETDLIYSYDTSSWEPIYLYEIVQVPHDIVSINCEPYDMFFTERMLTHDSSAI